MGDNVRRVGAAPVGKAMYSVRDILYMFQFLLKILNILVFGRITLLLWVIWLALLQCNILITVLSFF